MALKYLRMPLDSPCLTHVSVLFSVVPRLSVDPKGQGQGPRLCPNACIHVSDWCDCMFITCFASAAVGARV